MLAMNVDQSQVNLSELLSGLVDVMPADDREITGIETDSRKIQPGNLFIALPGTREHGSAYVAEAIDRGAVAVVIDQEWAEVEQHNGVVPVYRLAGAANRVGPIASRFYGHPSRHMSVIGITGTNGKTSCSVLIAQCLEVLGSHPSVIGTIGAGRWGQLAATSHTTPDAVTLQKQVALLYESGSDSLVMEVSSHGLEQGRVAGTDINIAVFTNLSQDHLDYHGSMQEYGAAKAKLFHQFDLAAAVINADDTFGKQLLASEASARRIVSYGIQGGDVRAKQVMLDDSGIVLDIDSPWGELHIDSALMGRFNVYNLLASAAVLLVLGHAAQDVASALSAAHSAPGRMEHFHASGLSVIVDFAHTPDALEQVLKSLREHVPVRKLYCVFGCGGDRDPGKRPQMGAIAENYADEVIVTDDNPRHEDAATIRADIIAGIKGQVHEIGDRRQAISSAIDKAQPGDIVLVAGKGHETTQQVGDMVFPFSDREVVSDLLEGAR